MHDELLKTLVLGVNEATIGLLSNDSLDPNTLRALGLSPWQATSNQICQSLDCSTLQEDETASHENCAGSVPQDPNLPLWETEDAIQVTPLVSAASSSFLPPDGRIFKHLFMIRNVTPTNTTLSVRDATGAARAVAMYNLGLAQHMAAMKASASSSSSSSPLLLQGAKEAYGCALDTMNILPMISPDKTFVFVYLAICNNLAELSMDDPIAAKEYKDMFVTGLWPIPPATNSPTYRHFALVNHVYSQQLGLASPVHLTEMLDLSSIMRGPPPPS